MTTVALRTTVYCILYSRRCQKIHQLVKMKIISKINVSDHTVGMITRVAKYTEPCLNNKSLTVISQSTKITAYSMCEFAVSVDQLVS